MGALRTSRGSSKSDAISTRPMSGLSGIAIDFPATVERYGNDIDCAIDNFAEASATCVEGERELFCTLLGEKVVGICIVTKLDVVPAGINPDWPNLSGFIMNPYRGIGLGRFSLEQRLEIVHKNFGNNAWTLVRDGNLVSEHLVQSVGFKQTTSPPDENNRMLYTYDASNL